MNNKLVIHVDGDAFFASCEISRRPDLKGKPVVVGEEKGIVCALSYEAKALGVTRCMPIFEVKERFKDVTILHSHFELYEQIHRKLVKKLLEYFDTVESYSIDECFVELNLNEKVDNLRSLIKNLKKDIQDSLGVTFSFGISYTKTLAKIASKRDKPNGCTFLLDQKIIDEVLKETLIGGIWGIGQSTSIQMTKHNIYSAYSFIKKSKKFIESFCNEPVLRTWYELQGKKVLNVESIKEKRKSVQVTRSLSYKTKSFNILYSELSKHIERATEEMRNDKLFTNSVYIFFKSKYPTQKTFSASKTIPYFTQSPQTIMKEIEPIINTIFDPQYHFKSTGVTLNNLRSEEYIQDDLFNNQTKERDQETFFRTIDAINRKLGPWTIHQASSLNSIKSRNKEEQIRNSTDNYIYGLPYPYMGEVF